MTRKKKGGKKAEAGSQGAEPSEQKQQPSRAGAPTGAQVEELSSGIGAVSLSTEEFPEPSPVAGPSTSTAAESTQSGAALYVPPAQRGLGRGRGRGRGPVEVQVGYNVPGENRFPDEVVKRQSADAVVLKPGEDKVKSAGRGRGRNGICAEPKNGMVVKMPSSPQAPPLPQETKKFKKSNAPTLKIMLRPENGYGTEGRPIELIANFYKIKSKCPRVFHYDVDIKPCDAGKENRKPSGKQGKKQSSKDAEPRKVGRQASRNIISKLIETSELQSFSPVYDGNKNVFTKTPLPFKGKQSVIVELEMEQRVKKYEIIIQPVEKTDGSNIIDFKQLEDLYTKKCDEVPDEVLLAFNTIANYREPSSHEIQVGRSFFSLTQTNKIALGEGLEIWFGYNQSIHLTEQGPAFVVNLSAKAFHKEGPLIEYANEVLRKDIRQGNLKPYEIRKLETALRGVRIEVTHMKNYRRKYYIQGITKVLGNELMIDIDNKKYSVSDYFAKKYFKLRYPNLNCIHVRSNTNKTYLPFEVCNVIKGQPKAGKLNEILQGQMVRKTAIAPAERFHRLEDYVRRVNSSSGENLREFGMFMEIQPMLLPGRVIDPPKLMYNQNYRNFTVEPSKQGTWRIDGKKFYKSPEVDDWVIISFSNSNNCSDRELNRLARCLSECARNLGLDFGELVGVKQCGNRDYTDHVLKWAKSTEANFALVILSRRDMNHSYDEVKYISDYQLSLITQCIDDKHFEPDMKFKKPPKIFDDQYLKNLCLKINAKLGGVNHALFNKLEMFTKPIIVLGADAIHAARGSGCPSIASVVGSLDAFPSKYKVACRVQENPDDKKISQELIIEMREMLESIFHAFLEKTHGKIPEKIIFFRDGVSEGQFELVLQYEVMKLKEACEAVFNHLPPITFIIVQKRHQTRFHPRNFNDAVGKAGNIPPGTLADRKITHPRYFDYYLCSHEGIQGTSKPAHYTVLHDENHFSANELHKLSYHLCHMYNRCNRSVSIPAPVKYADLAAYRAKKYADWHISRESQTSSSSGSNDSACKLPDFVRDAINNMDKYTNDMFYV